MVIVNLGFCWYVCSLWDLFLDFKDFEIVNEVFVVLFLNWYKIVVFWCVNILVLLYIWICVFENMSGFYVVVLGSVFWKFIMENFGYVFDVDLEEIFYKSRCKRCSFDINLVDIVYDLFLINFCVFFLCCFLVVNFCCLWKKFDSDDKRWILDFLRWDGLDLLFECFGDLVKYISNFFNFVFWIECIMCIKIVMNLVIGF